MVEKPNLKENSTGYGFQWQVLSSEVIASQGCLFGCKMQLFILLPQIVKCTNGVQYLFCFRIATLLKGILELRVSMSQTTKVYSVCKFIIKIEIDIIAIRLKGFQPPPYQENYLKPHSLVICPYRNKLRCARSCSPDTKDIS